MRAVFVLLTALVAAPVARAEDAATDASRYTMTPTGDGFLRLDTRTGNVSLCAVKNGAAECRAAADDRAALESEIDRLQKRNAELEANAKPASPLAGLPSREDMGKALDLAEDFMRRMMRIMREPDAGDRDHI
jgi:hypothetical protein